jgi:hypothetical protein
MICLDIHYRFVKVVPVSWVVLNGPKGKTVKIRRGPAAVTPRFLIIKSNPFSIFVSLFR